jgi:hypothetical protein
MVLAALACAASLVLSASYRLYDTDLWTLLVTGKAIWQQQGIPRTDQWSWPNFGAPQIMSSWLFRFRIWPLWEQSGVMGLFVWRWLQVLATFGFLWAGSRRAGARGVSALVVLAWCGLVYRLRTDLRPELTAGVLFAATLWILETRRSGGRDLRPWLMLVSLLWANVHVTWYLLFVLWGLYLVAGRGDRPWKWVASSFAAAFANPWGWHGLWQPFEYALVWRGEPIFRTIGELQPLVWSSHLRDGLPLLIAAWAVLAVRRARRRGFDLVEALGGLAFTAAAVSSQRFLGTFALFAAPFFARDAHDWLASRPLPAPLAAPMPRGALAAVACLAIGAAEWTRPELPLGMALDTTGLPVAACDFVAQHGVRGRVLNDLHFGGYLLWRFWPERDRLPFVTTQPENSRPQDRNEFAAAMVDERAWRSLDRRARFDWVVLDRAPSPGERLLDFVDSDTSFRAVFMDDAAIVFARVGGASAAAADSFAFRIVPASADRRARLVALCERDPALRAAARVEFARQAAESPRNALAEQALGTLALMDGDYSTGRAHLEQALRVRPTLESARRMLEMIPAGH